MGFDFSDITEWTTKPFFIGQKRLDGILLINHRAVNNGVYRIKENLEIIPILQFDSNNTKELNESIIEIVLPNSVKVIKCCFADIIPYGYGSDYINWKNLRKVNIPESLESIGWGTFEGTHVFENIIFETKSEDYGDVFPRRLAISQRNRLVQLLDSIVPIDKIKSINYKIKGELLFSYDEGYLCDFFPEVTRSNWFSGERNGELILTTSFVQHPQIVLPPVGESIAKKVCRAIVSIIKTPRGKDPQTDKMSIFCKFCGKPISHDSIFCKHCGKEQ